MHDCTYFCSFNSYAHCHTINPSTNWCANNAPTNRSSNNPANTISNDRFPYLCFSDITVPNISLTHLTTVCESDQCTNQSSVECADSGDKQRCCACR